MSWAILRLTRLTTRSQLTSETLADLSIRSISQCVLVSADKVCSLCAGTRTLIVCVRDRTDASLCLAQTRETKLFARWPHDEQAVLNKPREGFGEHAARDAPEPQARPAAKAVPFANIRADLRAHGGDWGAQGFWALLVYRFGRWRYGVRPVLLRKPLSGLYKIAFKFVQIITGIELPCEVQIGRNFVIDHFGGIIISGYAKFGDNCRIRNGVCIGLSRVGDPCAAVIGNNVDIGAGAKLLGRITVGDNVLIGANSVVTRAVPANSVAVGAPAVIKPRRHVAPVPIQRAA